MALPQNGLDQLFIFILFEFRNKINGNNANNFDGDQLLHNFMHLFQKFLISFYSACVLDFNFIQLFNNAI